MKTVKKVKKIKRMILIVSTLCLSLILNQAMVGECTRSNNHHTDPVVHCCTYTQEDLQRAFTKTPERYQKGICFYCGCPTDEHTSTKKKESFDGHRTIGLQA